MSAGTFEAGEAVELAVVERSGFIESRHIGSAVVVAADGAVLRMLGNPSAPVFPRSCLKPFQALAVLEAIAGSAGSAGSHSTADHRNAANSSTHGTTSTADHRHDADSSMHGTTSTADHRHDADSSTHGTTSTADHRHDADSSALAGHVPGTTSPTATTSPTGTSAVAGDTSEARVELDAVQTVLATASHAGTPRHVEVVDSILTKGGLGREDLQCPADWPGDIDARNELVRERAGRASVYMNCSGKHAAMLYACRLNGWPTETYLELDHPLQRRIAQTVERLTGETIAATGIDGCGAPVHAVSLTGLARGIGRITAATEGPAATLTASVLANGWAIDGPGRANTLVIDELHVLAKLGAEGVMVMSVTSQTALGAGPLDAAPNQSRAGTTDAPNAPGTTVAPNAPGTTVALKMLDGNLRAASLVGLTLLVSVGALAQAQLDALLPRLDLTVYGGTTPVGAIRVSPTLVSPTLS